MLTRDELLDNVMLYWLPATGASSARLYWESFNDLDLSAPVAVPVGCSIFPKEIIRMTRGWAEGRFTDLRYWNELDKGGHFAAFEQPRAVRRRGARLLPRHALSRGVASPPGNDAWGEPMAISTE